MKLKALKEKRNTLLNELESMISAVEVEARSLNAEEVEAFDAKKAEIENIDATIARVKEIRAREMGTEEALVEERKADEVEKRALDNFFRGKDLIGEERAMLASSNTAIMPLEISKTIMKKLEEQCPVLEMARRFSSKGTLRLICEDNYGNAGVTAENTAFTDGDVTFSTIELKSHKITAKVSATFELLQNAEVNLSEYLTDVIIRRLAKELNKMFIVGTGSNQPQGLAKATNEVEYAGEVPTIEDFIQMHTAIHPSYLDKACWIVNRKTFQGMASLLDGTGRPYLTSNVIGEKIQYNLLGARVIVDVNVPEGEVILANIEEAYSINMLTDVTVRHLVETGFTTGIEVYAGYVMCDGKIVNQDAILVGKKNAGRLLAKGKK